MQKCEDFPIEHKMVEFVNNAVILLTFKFKVLTFKSGVLY